MEKVVNLVPEFIEESKTQIEEIREQLPDFLELLRNSKYPEFNAFNSLIRAVHSISGGCSVAEMAEMEGISSKLNKVIALIVSRKIKAGPQAGDIIERAVDLLESTLNNNGKVRKKDAAKVEKELDKLISESLEESDKVQKKQAVVKKDQKAPFVEEKSDPDPQSPEKNNEYLSFRIGSEHYAVPINAVYDMKQMLPCSRIPNQPDHFLGVANLRGNVIPVIDLRKVFGIKDLVYGEFTVFLMLKINEKIKGCVVDSIDDVVFLEPENTQTAPLVSRKIRTDFVKFIATDPKTKKFLIVLDIEKMLEND